MHATSILSTILLFSSPKITTISFGHQIFEKLKEFSWFISHSKNDSISILDILISILVAK